MEIKPRINEDDYATLKIAARLGVITPISEKKRLEKVTIPKTKQFRGTPNEMAEAFQIIVSAVIEEVIY